MTIITAIYQLCYGFLMESRTTAIETRSIKLHYEDVRSAYFNVYNALAHSRYSCPSRTKLDIVGLDRINDRFPDYLAGDRFFFKIGN